MAKTCLNKLSGNILTDCKLPTLGISNLYLMHIEDVTFTYSADGTQITGVTFLTGAKSYRVEGYKQNLQVTASLRSTDASTRFDVSVMFKANLEGKIAQSIMAGKFYVMAAEPLPANLNTVWGCSAPLECSNVDFDSNANGRLVTYTLAAPEGATGNHCVVASSTAANSIIAKSV